MATIQTIKTKIQGLIDKGNEATGNSATDLTTVVDDLIANQGSLSGGLDDENLKYFIYTINPTKRTITLHSLLYDELYAETGSYDVVIPDEIAGLKVIIKCE